jgi:hypothetical protein
MVKYWKLLKAIIPRGIILTTLGFWLYVRWKVFIWGGIEVVEDSSIVAGIEVLVVLFVVIWYSIKMWKELMIKINNKFKE